MRATGAQAVSGALPSGIVTVQAENSYQKSNFSLYPVNDNTSPYTFPYDPAHKKLNAIGGQRWGQSGQWISWEINVPESGLYQLGTRSKQNFYRDMTACRSLYIDGEIPFQEAADMTFTYSDDLENYVDESKLTLMYQDPSTMRWTPVNGIALDPVRNRISCTARIRGTYAICVPVVMSDFRNVKIYPNPFSPEKNPAGLVFDNITRNTKIRIYNVAGELMRAINADPNGMGTVTWDGKNEGGRYVGSGVYIAHLDNGSSTVKVKIIVER
jgi:hypothetical protein